MKVTRYKAENTPEFGKYWVLYLPTDSKTEDLAPDLVEKLGKLYPEEDLDLASDSILDDAEKKTIAASIESQGHHLEELSFSFGLAESDDDDEVEIEL